MMGSSIGKIIVVDDEVELKNILVEALTSQGYEALGFTDAEEALGLLREQSFDVLLTDLMMPGMDGIALMRESLHIDPNLVSIMMTGQGTIQTAVEAMKVGAFDYVPKPFRLQTMLPVLTRAMNTRHLRLENVQLREAVAIHELNETIAFTLDPQTVLSKLADAALVQSEADEVSVLLPTADGAEFYVAVVRGEKRERLLGERIPVGQSISSWVARQREPIILNGEVDDDRFVALWPRPDIRSSVSIPMLVARKLVGVLNLNVVDRPRPFTLGQMKALTILAGTAAAALESAALYTQVQKAEENYRSIFENAVEGIFQASSEGGFLTVNPAMARILGYDSPEDLIARLTDVANQLYVDPKARERAAQLQTERGVVQGFEFEAYRKDGKKIWLSLNQRSVRDESGTELYCEGSVEDITERKQAEDRVRQSESQMAEAQHLAHVGSWNWELANNILSWSDEHYHILGLDPKEFEPTYDTLVAEHIIPEDRYLVRSVVDGILKNHESFSFHYRVKRPDGEVRVVHSRGSLLCDEQGTPIRMFGTVQDVTESKRAEEERERLAAEIESQRQRLDNIVGTVPGVVWEAWGEPDDATQRINFVSDYVETMLGYSVDEWVSTPNFWLTIVHPRDRDRAGELSAAAFAAGRPVTMEFRWLAKDGRAIWVESNFVAIKNDQGQPVGLRGVTTDISERKRAEAIASRRAIHALFRADVSAALASSTSSLRDTLHLCAEAMVFHLNAAFARVWTFNREHSMLELQASAGLYTNLDGAHARVPLGSFKIGRIAESRIPHISNNVLNDPEVSDKAWAEREQMVAFAGYPLIVEERLIGVMAMFSREVLEDDTIDALDSVADIVSQGIERKRAEEALSESEERYRDLVENAHDIIYSHDLEGNYTSMNKAGQTITGYTVEEALKLNLGQAVAPEHRAKAREMLKRKLAGERVTAYEMDIIAKDGRRITVEANTKLFYQDGVPVGVQGIARDVTERKLLEEQLRQSQKMEAIGQLAGGVAHDFNNLLTAINGYSSLALQRIDDSNPMIKGYLEEIKKAGDRATNLTRQLLAFGRKQILQPLPINLNEVVTDMNKMLKRLIGEDIVLTAKLDSALKKIKADPGQIEQVLVNLVVNARDAMPQGGSLTIETAMVELDDTYANKHVGVMPGNYVVLAVSDTGVGMDEATQKRIFDPFFTTKEKGKGTGLGLSTVYGIIKQSGGNIWVYSEPGRGTTFKVYLPQIETTAPATQKAEAELPVPTGSETILLVEDEDVVRGLTREILEKAGYRVLDTARGEEAVEICSEPARQIHLLLTDVVMPEISGKDVADRVTKVRPHVKVLFMSGYTDEAIVHHGVLDSNVEFIQKPFTLAALARKVRDVLDSNGRDPR